MKKRTLLAMALTLVMCLGMATVGVDPAVSESSIAKTRASGKFAQLKIASVTPSFRNTEKDYGYATKHTSNSYTLGFCKGY